MQFLRSMPVVVSTAWRRHPNSLVTGLLVVAAWISLTVWLYVAECPNENLQGWIEIANGATWANNWHTLCCSSHGFFAVVVSTRTVLNFAAPLSVIGAGVWFVTGGLERAMKMNRQELMRMLSVEIVASIDALVRKNHPESYREGKELGEMQKIADQVVDGFMADVEKLDKESTDKD